MPQDVTDYLVRRRAVAEFERKEARAKPVPERLRELARLMASVDALGLREKLQEDDAVIWARWTLLRQSVG